MTGFYASFTIIDILNVNNGLEYRTQHHESS